jgi:hypothetical protein
VDKYGPDKYNLSPRKQFCGTKINSQKEGIEKLGCLMLIDTAMEKKIDIGTTYPFPPQT